MKGHLEEVAGVNLSRRSRKPIIQENLERPVTTAQLENVLNDFQTRMVAVVRAGSEGRQGVPPPRAHDRVGPKKRN